MAGSPAAASHDRGWRFLQAGDFRNAEREFETALKLAPAFYPSQGGLGYIELARKDAKAALPHFDRVLDRASTDVSALVGRAQTLLTLGREPDALAAFEAALAADASLGDVRSRVDVLRFRGQQDELNRAKGATRAGRFEEAAAIYKRAIERSPDSAFLYRELAAVERQTGENDLALEHLSRSVALEPGDARSLVQIGDLLEARGDLDGAAKAYADALLSEPTAEVEAKLGSVRARADLARLPEQYRAIDRAPQITRADLAALVGVRLAPLLQNARPRDAVVLTDIRNHWASPWIVAVTRAGVMDAFANHTFQPRTVVRRVDLAPVVNRLLGRIAETRPGLSYPWLGARLKFSDIAQGHLAYLSASVAVASGVMQLGPAASFQPSRPVTGREAIEAMDRLESMVRTGPGRGRGGR